MVSQQVFGECCEILEYGKDNWVRIRCHYDGYEGWCTSSHLTGIDAADYEQGSNALAPEWANQVEYNGHPMVVPLGTVLTSMKNGQADWKKNKVRYKGGAWDPAGAKKDARTIRQLAYKFLNTGYLWGGKTVFGIDCSGFTQGVFRFFDIPLLRDAHQQASQGESVGFLQEVRTGDLAFFDNEEGKITHVGILLNDHEIIHASGKVRVDKIDNMGIVHAENFQRTHKLRVIKRVVSGEQG
jgi:cell wall-associated NlpC family hydrolase